jgi:hypothetical protein
MKPGARLINTAHGSVVDEQAAADALKDGHLAGIAVDVYGEEPPYNSPLMGLDGVIHTPHIGDNTVEATQDLSKQVVEQVLDALRDLDYRNVINMPFMPGVNYETIKPYLTLAERMGTMLHVLARHPVKRMAVKFSGDEITGLVKPLTVAAAQGPAHADSGRRGQLYQRAPAGDRARHPGDAGKGSEDRRLCQPGLVPDRAGRWRGDRHLRDAAGSQSDPHIVQINEYRMNFRARRPPAHHGQLRPAGRHRASGHADGDQQCQHRQLAHRARPSRRPDADGNHP